MSVQKLIAEADKLLEKGKVPEAIEKLKSAFTAEPLNQLIATKLANIFVGSGDPAKAAKIYIALANRLSEAGKSQVAIAIYKQALELAPGDIELKFRFAKECEGVGKLGDAQIYAQQVLQHYIQRKKYFDASNVMPILVRTYTRDENFKLAWAEVMQFSQAEHKLPHLLVALCGPPGLTSQEFPTGGEPTAMSENLYEALKRLAVWFPRDAKIAYAVAWCAYRRERKADFFRYTIECLRREPDFCLGMLLFARWLAEQQKLNESLFVYKMLKERLTADKSVDMLTLNRQVETFVEKNGWINFTEGMGEALDAKSFLEAIAGKKEQPAVAGESVGEGEAEVKTSDAGIDLPAEIELSPSSGDATAQGPVELQLTGGETRLIASEGQAAPATQEKPEPKPEPKPEAKPKVAANDSPKAAPAPEKPPQAESEPVPGDEEESVNFTSIIKVDRKELQSSMQPEKAAVAPQAAAPAQPASTPQVEETTIPPSGNADEAKADSVEFTSIIKREELNTEVESKIQDELRDAFESPPSFTATEAPDAKPKPKVLFNPLEAMNAVPTVAEPESESDKTQIFSPIDVLQATNVVQQKIAEPATKMSVAKPEVQEKAVEPQPAEYIEGERTMMFSPVEAVDAGAASRRPMEINVNLTAAPWANMAPPPPPPGDATAILPAGAAPEAPGGEATTVLPAAPKPPLPPPVPSASAPPTEATLAIPAGALLEGATAETPAPGQKAEPVSLLDEARRDVFSGKPQGFVPIPEPAPVAASQDAGKEGSTADMGDDLLEGPTKILVNPPPKDATAHLLKEIQRDVSRRGNVPPDAALLLRKAERYIAKRNYYLARKAIRHAQALGAEESLVKEKLREIRKLELPESLYSSVSSDAPSAETSDAILERLEDEFDLAEDSEGGEIEEMMDQRISGILNELDARTALDVGVALHEMGLFRNAENLLMQVVDKHPDSAFDAYYLAALSKSARKDYAGAASILKKLSADSARSDLQKVPVYYALGELFERMKQSDRSKSFFKKVAEIDSNYRNIREKLED